MKRAIVFPGQGSQTVGMGRALGQAFTSARRVFEEVDDALGQKLSRLMFEGPEAELTLTENAQAAIMASSIAAFRTLKDQTGWKPETQAHYFAGHSLGEYTALCAADALTLADTARLLKVRGQAMQKAVGQGEGAMAALLGIGCEKATEMLNGVTEGVCVVANDKSPEQVVISGSKAAVEQAVGLALAQGAKKAVMLQVSAPFHSPLMRPAAEAMRAALGRTAIRVPTLPIIANVTAQPTHDPETIRRLLAQQVCGLVRWRESVLYLAEQGVESTLELGTGRVLSGLIRRIAPAVQVQAIATPQEIEDFAKTL